MAKKHVLHPIQTLKDWEGEDYRTTTGEVNIYAHYNVPEKIKSFGLITIYWTKND